MNALRMISGRCGLLAAGAITLRVAAGGAARGALAAAVLSGAPALAQSQGQVASVEPYYVVTTSGEGVLRCGNLDTFYIIGNLKPGQVLLVDGESENWKRVAYPAGVHAFAPTEDVQISGDGRTATLTRPSNLKAANSGRPGLKGSWKNVFDPTPLPVGTKLTVVRLEQSDDGKKQAYRVEAPEGARAYIHNSYVRPATAEEVAAAGMAVLAGGAGGTSTAAPASTGAGTGGIAVPVATGTDLTAEQVAPGEGSAPAATGLAAGPGEVSATGERPIATPEQLNIAFEDVRKQPTVTAELDELVAEYQRTIDARNAAGADRRVTASLTQRLELLRLRKDLQAQLVALEEARQAASDAGRDAAAQVAEVNKTRHYEVIGRLTTSTVYDGKKLPMMYRVQSVGDAVARTLGYLKPDAGLELEKKIGQVVGISGQANMDPSLKLNVLTASRVDILSATPAVQEASAPDSN
jgi:hypothetical protein